MSLQPCHRCASLVPANSHGCPHCGAAEADTTARPVGMVLLGLSLAGCQEEVQLHYGVAITDTGYTDSDGDGYSVADGDCDDADPDIHPDAHETAGDGVDSNCDGEDDT